MPLSKIKKRNGTIVDFDRSRIETAIAKACRATGVEVSQDTLTLVVDDVVSILEKNFVEKIPAVEDIQDVVEKTLAERRLFEVARNYILYREQRRQAREKSRQQLLEKARGRKIRIKKRDGTTVAFDSKKVAASLKEYARLCKVKDLDVKDIVEECALNIFDGISTQEIGRSLVLALRGRIERDPLYSTLTARVLLNELYKDTLGLDEFAKDFVKKYRSNFAAKLKRGVRAGRLDARLLKFDLKKLAGVLKPQRDILFTYLGLQTIYDRYLLKDLEQRILEVPQYFWLRVSMGLALAEAEKDRDRWAIKFYDIISRLLYVPSTPTLFHSGTTHPQMSSCYLTTVEDDLYHIFKCIGDNAQLAKWSGGLGNDWTNIRATGSLIKSTNVGSQGVVPFLKIVDAATAAINRSGKRRGATCVYLETWHYDIEDFLELRKNTGDDRRRTHDTNTANWIPDLFMKRVINDLNWTLFSPEETPELHHIYGKKFERRYRQYEKMAQEGRIKLFKVVRARDLWRKMITMLFETGHPWITFKDSCNIRSPQDHVGVVHSSNLCTEITLNTSAQETAVCNLGSINLANHITNGSLDKNLLKETVSVAIRMLDNVIDLNFYPTKEAKHSNLRHRPIGLGVMGLQDVFYKLGINFDCQEAVDFSDRMMEFIAYHAILTSSTLAKEKGTYPSYKGSKWDRGLLPLDTLKMLEEERGLTTEVALTSRLDWDQLREHIRVHGMRNSNCLAIAPTATISNIAGCFPSVEPVYKNLYVKSNFSGEFTIVNKYMVNELKQMNFWTQELLEKIKHYDGSIQYIDKLPKYFRDKYKEVFEINPRWIILHGAYRGKWIDQSQSLNIFTTSTSGNFISDIYIQAWKMGLKTTYYLRTLGASGVEKSTLDINKQYAGQQEQKQAQAAEEQTPRVRRAQLSDEDLICEACE